VSFRHGHPKISLFGLVESHTGSPEFITEEKLITTGGDLDTEEVYSWAIPSGENLGEFTANFTSHTFSNDGNLMFTGNMGGMIIVLDPISGEEKDIFFGHDLSVQEIVLSPDSTMMLSESTDGTVIFRRLEEN
jgi:WD40 repeat protein